MITIIMHRNLRREVEIHDRKGSNIAWFNQRERSCRSCWQLLEPELGEPRFHVEVTWSSSDGSVDLQQLINMSTALGNVAEEEDEYTFPYVADLRFCICIWKKGYKNYHRTNQRIFCCLTRLLTGDWFAWQRLILWNVKIYSWPWSIQTGQPIFVLWWNKLKILNKKISKIKELKQHSERTMMLLHRLNNHL